MARNLYTICVTVQRHGRTQINIDSSALLVVRRVTGILQATSCHVSHSKCRSILLLRKACIVRCSIGSAKSLAALYVSTKDWRRLPMSVPSCKSAVVKSLMLSRSTQFPASRTHYSSDPYVLHSSALDYVEDTPDWRQSW